MLKNPHSRSSFFKIIFLTLLGFFLFLGLFVLSLPTIASSSLGIKLINSSINHLIPSKLLIKKMQLSWFGNQKIEHFALYDSNQFLDFETLEIDCPLWKILFNDTHLKALTIKSLNASFIQENLGSPIFLSDVHLNLQLTNNTNQLEAQISGKTLFQDKIGEIQLKTLIDQIQIPSLYAFYIAKDCWPFQFPESPHIQLKGELSHFPVEILDRLFGIYKPSFNGIFKTILGESLSLSLYQTGTQENSDIALKIDSPLFKGEWQGKIQDHAFILTHPGSSLFQITPELVEMLKQLFPTFNLKTENISTIELFINHIHLPFNKKIEDFSLVAHAKGNHIPLTDEVAINDWTISFEKEVLQSMLLAIKGDAIYQQQKSPFSFIAKHSSEQNTPEYELEIKGKSPFSQNLDLHLNLRGNQEFITGTLSGSSPQFSFQDVQFHLNQFYFDSDTYAFSSELSIDYLPTALIEKEALLGPFLSAKGKVALDFQNKAHIIDVSIKGEQFQATCALAISDRISLYQNRPISIDWTVTPERFASLRKLVKGEKRFNDIQLNEATGVLMTISDLQLPLSPSGQFELTHASTIMQLDLANVSIMSQPKMQKMILNKISVKMASHDLSEAIALEISSDGHHTHQTSLNFSAFLEQALKPDGKLNPLDTIVTLKGKIERAPIILLCNFICLNERMTNEVDAVIGEQLTAEVNAKFQNYTGPVVLNVSGDRGYLTIDGQLTDGVLTLNQPLVGYIKVTPKLHKSFLQNLVPFLSSSISSEKPLFFAADAEGFSLPIKTWDLEKISVGRAMIDLGKIHFSNDDDLQKILQFLNYTQMTDHLNIWFTPLYLQINQGAIHCDRMDMLVADLYPIAMWGNVNLPAHKVRLTIGLTGRTLSRAFDVKGLPENAMLQLPLKGTTSNVQLDTKKAVKKVRMLIAKDQNTPHGVLIGGILDILGAGEEDPPKPTTNPLPWRTDDNENANPILAPLSIPLKMIEKGASEIIKFFK